MAIKKKWHQLQTNRRNKDFTFTSTWPNVELWLLITEVWLIPSTSVWPEDILARACSIKVTISECVLRKWDICKMWLQYCGHSTRRSTNCSNAKLPNMNICNIQRRSQADMKWNLNENHASKQHTLESAGLRNASRTYRRAIPRERCVTRWCLITEPNI